MTTTSALDPSDYSGRAPKFSTADGECLFPLPSYDQDHVQAPHLLWSSSSGVLGVESRESGGRFFASLPEEQDALIGRCR